MTPKQIAFVAEYLVDKNATQAAIRAGYSAKTANEQGARLLANVSVRATIDSALAKQADTLEISAARILRERARLAFLDPGKLFDADGQPIPIQNLDPDTRACIVGIEVQEQFEGHGEERRFIGYMKKYRLAGKDASLAALEKRFGLVEKPIRFKLPPVTDADSCAQAQAAIIEAVSRGDLLPTEADTLSRLVEAHRRSLETQELERRVAALEEKHGPTA
jgi:phage terminase small subunit